MYCLCSALVIVLCSPPLHSKHIKQSYNYNSDSNHWAADSGRGQVEHHKYHDRNIWNSFEPSLRDSSLNSPSSTQFPPYYLSYDSGIKTSYQAIEEKLFDDQDKLNEERYRINQEYLASVANPDQSGNSPIQMPESQIKERTEDRDNTQSESEPNAVTQEVSPTPAPDRTVGLRGLDGTFGFMVGKHFYRCDKPKYLDRDKSTGQQRLPWDYYHKCQYWDKDPRRQFQRKVGRLGRSGYYGYFQDGRFIECAPPADLDRDEDDPNLFYIPNDLGYDQNCQYYGYNVSKLYGRSSDRLVGSFAYKSTKTDRILSVVLPIVATIAIFTTRLYF